MPKLKLGAAFYALVTLSWFVSAVVTLRGYGSYAEAAQWYRVAIATVFALTGVMFAIGAVTRRGLDSPDGPRICRDGWIVVAVLVAAAFVVSLRGESDWGTPFPNAVAAFIPRWVRRLQEKYYEGVREAELELSPAELGEGRLPPG
jgi:hypothetical protein